MQVVVPAAFSGIAAAFIIGLSRAVGETMIVAPRRRGGTEVHAQPLRSGGNSDRLHCADQRWRCGLRYSDYNSIFALGLLLFLITLTLNMISRRIVEKYREVYE